MTAKQLLSGAVPTPHWADGLIETLKATVGSPIPGWVEDEPMTPDGERPSSVRQYSFTGLGSDGQTPNGSMKHKKAHSLNPFNRKKSFVEDDYFNQEPRTARSFGESSRSTSDVPAPSSTKPTTFDGFADDDDDPWGDSPSFRPAAGSSPFPASFKQKTPAPTHSMFATHFDSDFVPDAPPPNSAPSPFAPKAADPLPDLTTPLNAFSFSMESPKPVHPVTNPVLMQQTGSRNWADHYKFRPSTQSPSTPSYRSGSPGSGPPSISHSPVSNKPIRKLSTKKGLKEPAPPGAVKAIALFDYAATEVRLLRRHIMSMLTLGFLGW